MSKYILILFCLIAISCSTSYVTKSEFAEKSDLRRFKVETTINRTSSGYLFFFIGGYSSDETSKTKIKFYAKNKLDEYCLFECNLKYVKIKLDSTINNAYVAFKYEHPNTNGFSGNRGLIDSLTYDIISGDLLNQLHSVTAIITCNPKDFPENVNLNQL